jgi:single-stranded DNA-binding protein
MKELKIGRLADKPELRTVNMKEGRELQVADALIYIHDRTAPEYKDGLRYGVPVKLVAWGERAEALAECNKSEMITVMGETKAVVGQDKEGKKSVSYGVVISSIYRGDVAKKLNKQVRALFTLFEKGEIDAIYDLKSEEIVREQNVIEEEVEQQKEMSQEQSELADIEAMMDMGLDEVEEEEL